MAKSVEITYADQMSVAQRVEIHQRRTAPNPASARPAIPNCCRASHAHIAMRLPSSPGETPSIIVSRQSALVVSNQKTAMRSTHDGGASIFVQTNRRFGRYIS